MRWMRLTISTLLAVVATASAAAAEFEAHELRHPGPLPTVLANPVRMASGEIWLRELPAYQLQEYVEQGSDPTETLRWLRFDETGAQLGVAATAMPGRLRLLADGSFIGQHEGFDDDGRWTCRSYLTRDIATVIWRKPYCTNFDQDAEGRIWQPGGALLADGSPGRSINTATVFPPPSRMTRTAMAARQDQGGVYGAFADSVTGQTSEVIAFDAQGQITWRRALQIIGGRPLRVQALQAMADGSVYVFAANGIIGSEPAAHLYVARIDRNGQLLWERRHGNHAFNAITQIQRFANGSFAVVTDRANIISVDADGAVLRTTPLDSGDREHVEAIEFVDLGDGGNWVFFNLVSGERECDMLCVPVSVPIVKRGMAIQVDGPTTSAFELGIGQYLGSVVRSDDKALLFGSSRPGSAALFANGSIVGSVPFARSAVPEPFIVLASAQLPDGDTLTLTRMATPAVHGYLTRWDQSTGLVWQREIGAVDHGKVAVRDGTPLIVVDVSHACIVQALASPISRALNCTLLADGSPSLLRLIPGDVSGSVHATANTGAVELLFTDEHSELRHWRVGMNNTLQANNNLGATTVEWFEPGFVLARTGISFIGSITQPPSVTTRTFPGRVFASNEHLVHFSSDSGWLTSESTATHTTIRSIENDSGATLWTRTFAGIPASASETKGGLIDTGVDGNLYLWLRTPGETFSRLHFIVPYNGLESAPAQILPADEIRFVFHQENGANGDIDGIGVLASAPIPVPWHQQEQGDGTITWRSFSYSGAPQKTATYRCASACFVGEVAATTDGDLDIVASSVGTGVAFAPTRLTLAQPFAERKLPQLADGAFTGVFVAENDTNRGYVIDYLPSSRTVFAARFAGGASDDTRMDRLNWESYQGVLPVGATDFTLTRYFTSNGRFGDGGSATTRAIDQVSFRFDGCDRVELVSDTAHTTTQLRRLGPRVNVCRLQDGQVLPADQIVRPRGGFDTRQSGAWISLQAPNEGLLLGVVPATDYTLGVFFAPWFTYWPDANQNPGSGNRHWFTLQSTIYPSDNNAVELVIYRSTAGSHDALRPSNNYRVGSATWTLTSCESATLSYRFDADEAATPYAGRQGTLAFIRPNACNGGP